MKATILQKDNYWEILLYNSLNELIDRIYIEELKLVKGEQNEE